MISKQGQGNRHIPIAKSTRSATPRAARQAPSLIPVERIERSIFVIRGQKVMLDEDLAVLYQVETRSLIQAVKRNPERFPDDFMFQLSETESAALRSQTVISNPGRGGRRYLPYAFTEQGVAMLSSVLRSPRAVQVNIAIMRAFVRLRRILATHKDLARKIADREKQFAGRSAEHETHIRRIYALLDELINPPAPSKKGRIGFRGPDDTD